MAQNAHSQIYHTFAAAIWVAYAILTDLSAKDESKWKILAKKREENKTKSLITFPTGFLSSVCFSIHSLFPIVSFLNLFGYYSYWRIPSNTQQQQEQHIFIAAAVYMGGFIDTRFMVRLIKIKSNSVMRAYTIQDMCVEGKYCKRKNVEAFRKILKI